MSGTRLTSLICFLLAVKICAVLGEQGGAHGNHVSEDQLSSVHSIHRRSYDSEKMNGHLLPNRDDIPSPSELDFEEQPDEAEYLYHEDDDVPLELAGMSTPLGSSLDSQWKQHRMGTQASSEDYLYVDSGHEDWGIYDHVQEDSFAVNTGPASLHHHSQPHARGKRAADSKVLHNIEGLLEQLIHAEAGGEAPATDSGHQTTTHQTQPAMFQNGNRFGYLYDGVETRPGSVHHQQASTMQTAMREPPTDYMEGGDRARVHHDRISESFASYLDSGDSPRLNHDHTSTVLPEHPPTATSPETPHYQSSTTDSTRSTPSTSLEDVPATERPPSSGNDLNVQQSNTSSTEVNDGNRTTTAGPESSDIMTTQKRNDTNGSTENVKPSATTNFTDVNDGDTSHIISDEDDEQEHLNSGKVQPTRTAKKQNTSSLPPTSKTQSQSEEGSPPTSITQETDMVTPSWFQAVVQDLTRAIEEHVLQFLKKMLPDVFNGTRYENISMTASVNTSSSQSVSEIVANHLTDIPPYPPTTPQPRVCTWARRLHNYTLWSVVSGVRTEMVSSGPMESYYPMEYLSPEDQGYNEDTEALEFAFNNSVLLTRLVFPENFSNRRGRNRGPLGSNVAMFWLQAYKDNGWQWVRTEDHHTQVYTVETNSAERQTVHLEPPIETSGLRFFPQTWTSLHPRVKIILIGCH